MQWMVNDLSQLERNVEEVVETLGLEWEPIAVTFTAAENEDSRVESKPSAHVKPVRDTVFVARFSSAFLIGALNVLTHYALCMHAGIKAFYSLMCNAVERTQLQFTEQIVSQ